MHQPNRATHRIDQINRAAIRHVDAETNATLIRNQAITTIKAFVSGDGIIDNRHAIPMHLLRGDEWRGAEAVLGSDFAMNAIQPGERFRFVVRHLDPRHPQGETVRDLRQSAERGELFSRKLTHLLPVVVRVVVRCTGGRLPARFNSSGLGFGAGVGRASVFSLLRVKGSSSSFE